MITLPDPLSTRLPHPKSRRVGAVCLLSAAALLHAPCLRAQSDTPKPAQENETQPGATKLYSLKFSGGSVEVLAKELKAAFPRDNVVVSGSLQHLNGHGISEFEVRDVRLKELGRTIEFLSDSKLVVEVAEGEDGATGNTWRIGSQLANTPSSLFRLQMRSVAAPNLFNNKEKAERVREDAVSLEGRRLERILETTRAGYNDIVGGARVEMLPEQRIFVIVGTEDGIEGIEGFIQAAEQLAVEEAARKTAVAASLAPKMRAVFAPHLFANEARLQGITEEFGNVQGLWNDSHAQLMNMAGIDDRRGGVCVQQRPEQKLFVLIGSEEDIAGMESLIQAAEKNAEEVDAAILKKAEAAETTGKSE